MRVELFLVLSTSAVTFAQQDDAFPPWAIATVVGGGILVFLLVFYAAVRYGSQNVARSAQIAAEGLQSVVNLTSDAVNAMSSAGAAAKSSTSKVLQSTVPKSVRDVESADATDPPPKGAPPPPKPSTIKIRP